MDAFTLADSIVSFDIDPSIRIQSWNGTSYTLGKNVYMVVNDEGGYRCGQMVRSIGDNTYCRIDAMMAEAIQIHPGNLYQIHEEADLKQIRHSEHNIALQRIEYYNETTNMLSAMGWHIKKSN